MTGIFAEQAPTHLHLASHQPSASTSAPTDWCASPFNMDPFNHQPPAQYAHQQHSSPLAGPSNFPAAAAACSSPSSSKGNYLPEQIFSSSPTERSLYPASTMAAVNATRARFFAQHSSSSSSRSRSRPTSTGSTTRSYKPQPFSTSSSSSSYRKSFFERCQRAMDTSRSTARNQRISSFRKGVNGGSRELFSDEMDQDDDDEMSSPPPSSPPEEDEELTRRRVIAEYARLKRVYEAKGHAEIGWLDPDQLEWLEREMKGKQSEGEQVDPYWDAPDDVLEELWRESMQSSQCAEGEEDVGMQDEFDVDDEFEEALAMLPV